jgi:hypothetical protein
MFTAVRLALRDRLRPRLLALVDYVMRAVVARDHSREYKISGRRFAARVSMRE